MQNHLLDQIIMMIYNIKNYFFKKRIYVMKDGLNKKIFYMINLLETTSKFFFKINFQKNAKFFK